MRIFYNYALPVLCIMEILGFLIQVKVCVLASSQVPSGESPVPDPKEVLKSSIVAKLATFDEHFQPSMVSNIPVPVNCQNQTQLLENCHGPKAAILRQARISQNQVAEFESDQISCKVLSTSLAVCLKYQQIALAHLPLASPLHTLSTELQSKAKAAEPQEAETGELSRLQVKELDYDKEIGGMKWKGGRTRTHAELKFHLKYVKRMLPELACEDRISMQTDVCTVKSKTCPDLRRTEEWCKLAQAPWDDNSDPGALDTRSWKSIQSIDSDSADYNS
eukprot:CAMPEP_0196584924 /NCGR_PEP_ID=MMETSP1081-20130531/48994_1 /TAXON_ID=36882 /ORGANISM="Pyramimonas amylifera, Strain CCMP720" /LENGTH=276 /DNA_ID=CAMNT_0041906311 /DNA_START=57 /DNA_END=886 /DNA_ORIENTATION=+